MTRRRLLLTVLLLAPLLAPQQWAMGQPLEFELHYQELSSLEEYYLSSHRVGSFNAQPSAGSPFTQSLVAPDRNLVFYREWGWAYHSEGPKQLAWIAAELDGSEVRYLFLDFDGDGKLSGNEKLRIAGHVDGNPWFVTPDFKITTENGQTWPSRLILTAQGTKGIEVRNGSVWVGWDVSGGKNYRLTICDTNANGSPTECGEDVFLLQEHCPVTPFQLRQAAKRVPTEGVRQAVHDLQTWRYSFIAKDKFSSHVRIGPSSGKSVFWECEATTGTPPVIRFRKDTRALGTISITQYPANLQYEYDPPVIVGEKDSPSSFFLRFRCDPRKDKLEIQVPEGRYRIRPPGKLLFPETDGERWEVSFSVIPSAPFDVPSGTTTVVELARPVGLFITPYGPQKSPPSGPQGGGHCVQGEDVRIGIAVKGVAGDKLLYGAEGSRCLRGSFHIVSSDGETVFEGESGDPWNTSKTPAGKYTIKATYPIPPLHTEMKDEISFEVKPAGPSAQGGDSR